MLNICKILWDIYNEIKLKTFNVHLNFDYFPAQNLGNVYSQQFDGISPPKYEE